MLHSLRCLCKWCMLSGMKASRLREKHSYMCRLPELECQE